MKNEVIKIKDICVDFTDVCAFAPSVYPVNIKEKNTDETEDATGDKSEYIVNTYNFPAINVYFKCNPDKPLVMTYSSVEERDHYYMEMLGLINITNVCADYVAPEETEEE